MLLLIVSIKDTKWINFNNFRINILKLSFFWIINLLLDKYKMKKITIISLSSKQEFIVEN